MHVIGTAGHVDHGKSTLIKNITSINPDRLKEEKEREMTIDLGFAWLNNTNTNEPVGIIDVPGHEDLVDNMLKGVFAIDLALLVVAATESIKQQTIEHLEILKLLNIPRIILIVTKKDLASEEMKNKTLSDAINLLKDYEYDESKNIDYNPMHMRRDVGFGFRWISPMGPLKLDFGFPLGKRRSGEDTYEVQFSIGSLF